MNETNLLTSSLAELKLTLTPKNCAKSWRYIELLLKWNKVHNLTAALTSEEIMLKHFLDSLSIASYIKGPNVLDFGSGGGFPGIPLALALPQYQFTLLDSHGKKTRFLNQVVLELKLANIEVVTKRIEDFVPQKHFATIVTRATSSLHDIIEKVRHVGDENTAILAMKGKYPADELAMVKAPYEVHKIQLPILNIERHLIKISNCCE